VCLCLSAGLTNGALEHFPYHACPETPKDSCVKVVLFPSFPVLSSFSYLSYTIPCISTQKALFHEPPIFLCLLPRCNSPSLDFLFQQPAGTSSSWPQRGCPLSSPSRTAQQIDQVCLDTLPRPPSRAIPLHQSLLDQDHQDLVDFKKLRQPIRAARQANS
jgi:hypothetical protein